jgi:sulfite exporter TauE/SafE
MNDEENVKLWLDYLQNRLARFENYFNYMISTLLVMIGLIGSLIVSFSSDSFLAKLTGSLIVSIGIFILWCSMYKLLKTQIEKQKSTNLLIEKILMNEIKTVNEIKEEWEKIKQM